MIAIFLQPNRRKQLTYMSLDLEIWTHLLKLPLCCPHIYNITLLTYCVPLCPLFMRFTFPRFLVGQCSKLTLWYVLATRGSWNFHPPSGVKPFFITKTKSRFICYAAGKRLSPLPKLSTLSRSFLSQMDQNNRKTRENRECQ